jgi:DNA mismatch repair protein MutS
MQSLEDVTPIRKQYLEIKRQYPDAILFFRLGDFYETFDQDAETTAQVLDIVLTSRTVAKNLRVPMAGIPHHALDNYLARLIEKGFHVAICEQVGDQPLRGLFPRKVTRVITPGTVTEPDLLPADMNNYLVCVSPVKSEPGVHATVGIAYADITTGEFAVTELHSADLPASIRAELSRLRPAEVLHPESFVLPNGFPGHATSWPDWRFEEGRCNEELLSHFGAASLDGFGLRGMSYAIRSAGAVLQYLKQTQPSALNLLVNLNTYSLSEFMILDAATRRNLELTETLRSNTQKGTLLGELDRTITPMGKRLMRQWVSKPLLDVVAIEARLIGVGFFVENGLLRTELRQRMKSLGDLERLATRIVSGAAQPRDLVQVRSTLEVLPSIQEIFLNHRDEQSDLSALEKILDGFHLCQDELNLLRAAIADDPPQTKAHIGIIRSGFSAELDGVVERSQSARDWIANLEGVERERTGIKSLKVGYNKVFGYYIEISRVNSSMAPAEYIRKQTLVNAERFITPEMKEYEALVLNAEDRIHEIEERIFKEVCIRLADQAHRMLTSARALAQLDVLGSLAEVAAINGYVRPQVVSDDILEIRNGRHPVVEHSLSSDRFVPNDLIFDEQERIRIITGPNMSGKSTYLRQAALKIVLMAQMGSYIPADYGRIGLVDRIFTRIGAQDEIHAGQSTFMVEMIETANILHHATARSLLILDEVGRGTSTYDGVSIAWAVVEYIHNHPQLRSKTLFATHYHELTQLADLLPGVRNYNVAVSETDGKVVFLHRIVPGGADRSYGIHVGQLAGLPRPVVQRAAEILRALENSSGKAVRLDREAPRQLALFPETNPLLRELTSMDVNVISPIEALNKLFEWKKKFTD